MNVRRLPWLIALIGLSIPVIAGGLVGWPIALVWLVVLALVFGFTRSAVVTPQQKVVAAVLLLPVLLAAAWEGGWWLIPADITWLVLSLREWFAGRAASVG